MNDFKIVVEGPYASFNRPEMKVERVSYDVPTPCALEGMLKSIYWKPAIRYVIDQIVVFHPIDFINIRRNEVKDKVLFSAVKAKMQGNDKDISIYALDSRSQRAAMVLKNVKYGIQFHFEKTGIRSEEEENCNAIEKHCAILERRLEKGQSFRQPCFGCSEFPVQKIQRVENFDLSTVHPYILEKEDVDLGYMLYSLEFLDGGRPINNDYEHPKYSDKANAVYYRPHMKKGVIDVQKYKEERKC